MALSLQEAVAQIELEGEGYERTVLIEFDSI